MFQLVFLHCQEVCSCCFLVLHHEMENKWFSVISWSSGQSNKALVHYKLFDRIPLQFMAFLENSFELVVIAEFCIRVTSCATDLS